MNPTRLCCHGSPLLGLLLFAGCATSPDPTAKSRASNDSLHVHGSLRAMFHEGKTEATVHLASMLPNPHLYAVGALAGLAGEVTIVGGKVFLAYPDGAERARTEATDRTEAAATLLVAAEVPSWRSMVIDHAIRFEDLDAEIARLAAASDGHMAARYPFVLEGEFEDLQWHVIDGSRLTAGASSHEDHQAAAIKSSRERASATLVGFYSEHDQGVFTHMGSNTHVHCVLDEPLATGHVDHVTIPAGTKVMFPAAKAR